MVDGKKGTVSPGKLMVVVKLSEGKVESSGRWEKCNPADLSLAISYLEIQKRKLIDALDKMTMAGMKSEEI